MGTIGIWQGPERPKDISIVIWNQSLNLFLNHLIDLSTEFIAQIANKINRKTQPFWVIQYCLSRAQEMYTKAKLYTAWR